MDVNKAFRFMFDDKQWISKLLIGAVMSVLSFLIIPAFILPVSYTHLTLPTSDLV